MTSPRTDDKAPPYSYQSYTWRAWALALVGVLVFVSLVTGLAALLTDYKWMSSHTLFFYLSVTVATLAGALASRARRRHEQQDEGE